MTRPLVAPLWMLTYIVSCPMTKEQWRAKVLDMTKKPLAHIPLAPPHVWGRGPETYAPQRTVNGFFGGEWGLIGFVGDTMYFFPAPKWVREDIRNARAQGRTISF